MNGSPDGKWFAITFFPERYWVGEIGIISANGDQKLINVSKSGFSDYAPQWSKDGSILYWASDRSGMHSVAKTGPSESDIYGVFLTQMAYDKFKLKKDEFELLYNGDDNKDDKDKDTDSKQKKTKRRTKSRRP